MCDETTESENDAYLERTSLSRRELTLGATGAVAALWAGCRPSAGHGEAPAATQATPPPLAPRSPTAPAAHAGATGSAATPPTRSRWVRVETPDGMAEGFFVHPEGGSHPGVLMWPDVAGMRDAFERMATRLAAAGYAVLVVNPYYRSSPLPILNEFAQWRTPEGQAKIAPMRAALTPAAITRDATAFVAWLDAQDAVDGNHALGTLGYCMSGPFTFRTAAAAPERVGALASFHGGGLVTDASTSPHRLLSTAKAAALVCIAANDDAREPQAKSNLRQAFDAAGLPAEIEVYPAQHGWCVLDSPVYDEALAERAWARMLATLQAHL